MSPRTEKQFEEIRQEKTQLIMDSALKLFAENGFESTSISQIAKSAEISKGLLYNYFESKEALLLSILNHGFDEIIEIYDLNKDGVLEAHEMEYFLKETFRLLKEKKEFYKLYFQTSMQPSVFKYLEQKLAEVMRPLSVMTTRYFESMGFENPQAEATIFGVLIDGVSLGYVMQPKMFPLDMLQEELIKRYCHIKPKS